MQNGKPGWRTVESDEAKRLRWKVAAGDGPPHQAWYFAPDFKAEPFGTAFLAALRDVFWSPSKGRVTPGMDVKAELSNTLEGVVVLRVAWPERLVGHFTHADRTFVLCRAMRGDAEVDFVREWDGLSARRTMNASPTIMGDVRALVDGTDVALPNGLLRGSRSRVEAPAPTVSPDATTDNAPRLPETPPAEVPEPPRVVPRLARPPIVERPRPTLPAAPPTPVAPARLRSALPAPSAVPTPPRPPAPPAKPEPPEAPEPSERDPFLWVLLGIAGFAGLAFAVFRAFF